MTSVWLLCVSAPLCATPSFKYITIHYEEGQVSSFDQILSVVVWFLLIKSQEELCSSKFCGLCFVLLWFCLFVCLIDWFFFFLADSGQTDHAFKLVFMHRTSFCEHYYYFQRFSDNLGQNWWLGNKDLIECLQTHPQHESYLTSSNLNHRDTHVPWNVTDFSVARQKVLLLSPDSSR